MIPAPSECVCLTEPCQGEQAGESTFNKDQWKQQLFVTSMRVVQIFHLAQKVRKEVSKFHIHYVLVEDFFFFFGKKA